MCLLVVSCCYAHPPSHHHIFFTDLTAPSSSSSSSSTSPQSSATSTTISVLAPQGGFILLLLTRADAPQSQNIPVESKCQSLCDKTLLSHIICYYKVISTSFVSRFNFGWLQKVRRRRPKWSSEWLKLLKLLVPEYISNYLICPV